MTTNNTALALPDEQEFVAQMKAITRFQQIVKANMIKGHDYGRIPGTEKDTLFKPGAEKISKLLGLADTYEVIEQTEDWGKAFFHYAVRCTLRSIAHDAIVSTGLGSCNSMESRYRYRWIWPNEVPAGIDKATLVTKKFRGKTGKEFTKYRIDNDDIYTLVNTLLKMAKKRALVDAALSAGRLSDVFTQDIEDIAGVAEDGEEPEDGNRKPTEQRQPGPDSQEGTTASTGAEVDSKPVDWKDFYAKCARLGYETPADVRKALGVQGMPQWKEPLEVALEQLFERAKLSGRFAGMTKWQDAVKAEAQK